MALFRMPGQTLFKKLWDAHVVHVEPDGTTLLFFVCLLVFVVFCPKAFEGLKIAHRKPRRTDAAIAVPDHNVPTTDRSQGIADPVSRLQVETLDANCAEFGITEFKMDDIRQGIVHVIGPEEGLTLPGMTVVCGDSHTSTHGAFGALAFGIGTSEVEHVLATQCLWQKPSKTLLVKVEGQLGRGVTAKDIALAVIGELGTAGGSGYALEFGGLAIRAQSMEGCMTLCNMAIEAGARAGMVAGDQATSDYVKGRPYAPKGDAWDKAVAWWNTLHSDADAEFDRVVELDAATIEPQVTWGTSPEMLTTIGGRVPNPADAPSEVKQHDWTRALEYMGLQAGTPLAAVAVDMAFIGSCTNSRIEDLREAAGVAKGRKVAPNVKLALVVPGSGLVKQQAEAEGLDKIFVEAGFEWRELGCSMCLVLFVVWLV